MTKEHLKPMIKIYGERNSGTRFIHAVIKANVQTDHYRIDSGGYSDSLLGWKHGYPMWRPYCNYIFMFRNLKEWLASMYSYPYECWHIRNKAKSFQEFVEGEFWSSNRSQATVYGEKYNNILSNWGLKNMAYLSIMRSHTNTIGFNLDNVIADREDFKLRFRGYGLMPKPDQGWIPILENKADPKANPNGRDKYELTAEDEEFIEGYVDNSSILSYVTKAIQAF